MPTVTSQDVTNDQEAAELRHELSELQSAMVSLTERLVATGRGREVAERELARHQEMLMEAVDLRVALERRLAELESDLAATRTELGHERSISSIRAKLLADIWEARPWRRRGVMQRAARVEQLLKANRPG